MAKPLPAQQNRAEVLAELQKRLEPVYSHISEYHSFHHGKVHTKGWKSFERRFFKLNNCVLEQKHKALDISDDKKTLLLGKSEKHAIRTEFKRDPETGIVSFRLSPMYFREIDLSVPDEEFDQLKMVEDEHELDFKLEELTQKIEEEYEKMKS